MGSSSQTQTGLTGGKRLGFSSYEHTTAKKQTKREKPLSEMEVVVPWQALATMLRIQLLSCCMEVPVTKALSRDPR